ncbi:MAG: hypothetical protein JST58_04880 [Bacteroidetes bacterium]|nr:hypothetical protein [Bacteroidota bacterium]
MDNIIEILGKIGGIGGALVGVFAIVVLEILKKPSTPLAPEKTYKLLRLIIYLSFTIAIVGVLCLIINPIKNTQQQLLHANGHIDDKNGPLENVNIYFENEQFKYSNNTGDFDFTTRKPEDPGKIFKFTFKKNGYQQIDTLIALPKLDIKIFMIAK